MVAPRHLKATDKLMGEIISEHADKSFGGKVAVFTGDFRQTLSYT